MINQDKKSKKTLFVVIFRPWNLLQSIFRPWKPLFACSFCRIQKLDFSSFSTFLAQKRYFWIEFSNKNWYTGSPYSLEYLLKFSCRLGIIFMGFWTKNLKIGQKRPKMNFIFGLKIDFFGISEQLKLWYPKWGSTCSSLWQIHPVPLLDWVPDARKVPDLQ